jgi:hypothetical protein
MPTNPKLESLRAELAGLKSTLARLKKINRSMKYIGNNTRDFPDSPRSSGIRSSSGKQREKK